jgi:hypothetical protein
MFGVSSPVQGRADRAADRPDVSTGEAKDVDLPRRDEPVLSGPVREHCVRGAVHVLTVQLGDEPSTVAVPPGEVTPRDGPSLVIEDGKLQRVRRHALVDAVEPGEGLER